jgi:hypothetical protein
MKKTEAPIPGRHIEKDMIDLWYQGIESASTIYRDTRGNRGEGGHHGVASIVEALLCQDRCMYALLLTLVALLLLMLLPGLAQLLALCFDFSTESIGPSGDGSSGSGSHGESEWVF